MALLLKDNFMTLNWTSIEDLQQNMQGRESALEDFTRGSSFDVRGALHDFKQCGNLLHMSLAVAKTSPCSVTILSLMMKYQDACHSSSVSTHGFVLHCVEAMHLHQRAIKLFDADKQEKCAKVILKVGGVARQLHSDVEELIKIVHNLMELADKALVDTKQDCVDSGEVRAAHKLEHRNQISKEEGVRKRDEDLKLAQREAQSDYQKAAEKAYEEEGRLLTKDKKAVESLQARELLAKQHADKLAQDQLEQEVALLETLMALESLDHDGDSLEEALHCLDAVVKTLGKVKCVFINLYEFMGSIALEAERLKGDAVETSDMIEVAERDNLFESVTPWAALGLASLESERLMVAASRSADDKMKTLPDVQTRKEMVTEMIHTMTSSSKLGVERQQARLEQEA